MRDGAPIAQIQLGPKHSEELCSVYTGAESGPISYPVFLWKAFIILVSHVALRSTTFPIDNLLDSSARRALLPFPRKHAHKVSPPLTIISLYPTIIMSQQFYYNYINGFLSWVAKTNREGMKRSLFGNRYDSPTSLGCIDAAGESWSPEYTHTWN